MKQKKLILVKLIGIGNDESKRINNDDKDENDSIEKEGYKYNEDKCNNKDNDDDDSDNDDDSDDNDDDDDDKDKDENDDDNDDENDDENDDD